MNVKALPASYRVGFDLAAGGARRFQMLVNEVYCVSASADLAFRIYDENQNPLTDWVSVTNGQGMKIDVLGFSVEFRSTTGGTFTALGVSGEWIDNSFIISSTSAVNVTPSKTTLTTGGNTSCPNAAATLISAAGATIQRRWIRNGSATATVYIRSDATAAVSAIALGPGDVLIMENQSALYCYNVSGGAVTVYVDTETTT